ncbi:hypothetical protein GH5_06159 [Leishmania sp. Ghana 2012 LV757]|uniref:hypothetical protein n=1 Tax=Leishmania sp. Ghana 2012 LV757 TaxID=2803181 RepID=UPI001B4D6609|nr:hypothetical protein GH5_06159 [Leishmania sp. Ghana 2012 LV757]
MQSRQHCRKPPPPPPPRWSSCDTGVPTSSPHATLMSSSSELPNAALTQQPLHPSARMPPPVVPHWGGAPAASAFTSPPSVSSPAFPLLADSTMLSVHSAASGSTPRIDVRDVAELVRHLAQSRCMTRQLQQRVHQMESSFTLKAAALGESIMSDAHAQRSTMAAAQATDERLATSGEAEADAAAEQAGPSDYHTQETGPHGRRRRTANVRGGESTRTASPTSVRASKKTSAVSAAFRQARTGDSHSSRTRHRCFSTTSSFAATSSTNGSATSSSLPSTSPPSSIAESPLRRVLPSPSSRCASNEVSSTASTRRGRRRTSQRQRGPRRTRSAPESSKQRPRSSSTNRHSPTAGVLRKPEKQHRRNSAARRRARVRSQKRHHRKSYYNDGHTTTADRGGGETLFEAYAASASLARHRRRSSATGSRRHHCIRSSAAEAAREVCIPRSPHTPAALPALNGTRGSSSRKEKALVWQRRYYGLLARYADETKRRDADLADIHEMIECISWEQDQSRHCHGQCHRTQAAVEREVEDSAHLPSRGDAASRDCAQGIVDAAGAASDERAVAAPQAVGHTANSGNTRTKDDDRDPSGHATASEAATPVHDSLEYVEALRCEADAWRQRCLALLRQQQQRQQRLGTEATWASDASVAPLPPRPSSVVVRRSPLSAAAGPTSSQAEVLTSMNASTMVDEDAVVVSGIGDGAHERDASTAAAHRIENVGRGKTPPPTLPSCPSAPAPVAEQAAQRASRSASRAEAASAATSSSAHHLYHPYAPPRLASDSHVSSVGAANFDARFPTPPPSASSSSARQPAHLLSVAPSPPAGLLSPAASSPHLSPARPPLFTGVPGYESLVTRAASQAAWPSQFLAPPPADKAPPFSTGTGVTFPASASALRGAPFFDASESSSWGDVTRGGVQQDHGHVSSSTSPWLLDVTLQRQLHRDLPASSPASVPETLTPYPHACPLFHVSSPSSMAAEQVIAREQLERDIRRHDQLLAAIGKLQKTAAEHATRRAF